MSRSKMLFDARDVVFRVLEGKSKANTGPVKVRLGILEAVGKLGPCSRPASPMGTVPQKDPIYRAEKLHFWLYRGSSL